MHGYRPHVTSRQRNRFHKFIGLNTDLNGNTPNDNRAKGIIEKHESAAIADGKIKN